MAKFADALKQFEPIYGQPSDTDLTRIWEVVAPLLLTIPYEITGSTHNLVGLIWPVAAYTMRYGAEFVELTRVRAYYTTISDNATSVVPAHTEAAHEAKRADHGTYKTARQENAQFILAIVEDTWVRELRDMENFYTDVAPKVLLAHLQAGAQVAMPSTS